MSHNSQLSHRYSISADHVQNREFKIPGADGMIQPGHLLDGIGADISKFTGSDLFPMSSIGASSLPA